jgi:hypothetical protein
MDGDNTVNLQEARRSSFNVGSTLPAEDANLALVHSASGIYIKFPQSLISQHNQLLAIFKLAIFERRWHRQKQEKPLRHLRKKKYIIRPHEKQVSLHEMLSAKANSGTLPQSAAKNTIH